MGTVSVAPSDANGDVGATQYVQWVNRQFAIFDKSGGVDAQGNFQQPAVLYGPVPGNTLWQGFGGDCETSNDGDPIVLYDQLANRWVMTQFAARNGAPYFQCVAVSTTSDATGTYNRYAFEVNAFNDYTKFGLWPDAYYASFNMYNGSTSLGAKVCAFDRTAMLNGRPATQVCFDLPNSDSLLPSDLDGNTPPPAGAPNYFLNLGANALNLWKFHVDFATPANSTLTGPTNIPVAPFTNACVSGGSICIPQSETTTLLDSLGDRLMHRFAYRNFGNHESLVVNHSVNTSTSGRVGIRWYELRNPGGAPVVFQQGTYAPDANSRWMGSIAMDRAGDIALGYSVSSAAMHPAIRFTGRVPGDALNALQAEASIVEGGGSQTFGLSRWGDYTSMSVDPVDDCTFWYTNQYLQSNGAFNWSTRIGVFRFPTCSSGPSFSLAATPANQSIPRAAGASTTYTLTVTPSGGFTGVVTLAASGLPAGVTATFNPSTVTTSGSSTVTLATDGSTPLGSFPVTVSGTSGSTSKSATLQLDLKEPFSVTASPATSSARQGGSTSYTVTVTPTPGFSNPVTLSISGLPAGASASFSANPINGGSSTLTVAAGAATPLGAYSLTVIGTSGSLTNSATIGLSVTSAAPAADFTLSAASSSSSVVSGGTTTNTVNIGALNGFNGTVSLSISGLPPGVTASFNPPSVSTSGSSTVTLNASGTAAAGTHPLTITGTSGSLVHAVNVSLVLTRPVAGDFTVSATPTSRTVNRNRVTSYTVTVGALNGFTGAVTMSVSGLPAGTTATFTPNPIATSGSATMRVSTTSATPLGTFTLTIQGVSGGLSHTRTVTLTVVSSPFG